MYGLVNKAVESLVLSKFGQDTWEIICEKANISGIIISMKSYDDQVTYDLVGACVEVLEMSVEDVLHTFGEYWVLDVAVVNYSSLMDAHGMGFVEFVKNLDQMHSRIQMTFDTLNPPSSQCQELDAETIKISYFSERPGLTHFVVGLLSGLGKHFREDVNIEILATKADGAVSDDFRVTDRPISNS